MKIIALLLALSTTAAGVEAPKKPYDVEHPPFTLDDYSWMNGNNRQPPSLLTSGPLTFSLYVDAFYAYQLSNPKDQTIFPTTVAARHNEFGVNLASFGVEVTGLDGPIGRLYLQDGINTETDSGQDPTTQRGYYLQQRSMLAIQQAGAGWHFHTLDGINFEVGLFPSYVGLESYLPQENWNYLRPFLSDFTPYYFTGSRTQIFFTQRTKLEVWIVNGWQTYGKNNDAFGVGYLFNWRPNGNLSLTHSLYNGSEEPADRSTNRFYTDNYFQWHYYRDAKSSVKSLALSVVLDYGYETRGDANANGANGPMYGTSISNRFEFNEKWAAALRFDYYYDKTKALLIQAPRASDGAAAANIFPDPNNSFKGSGYTATLDFTPSPWLIYRLEYMHREANIPFFSGPGGITSADGIKGSAGAANFVPDLRNSDDRIVANVTLRL